MINEVVEVMDYLSGKNISKNNIYRMCYLIAKWFKAMGLEPVKIRERIFEWANENGLYIKQSVNDIIHRALTDKKKLRENVEIKISKTDIEEIEMRFDKPKTKLVALAILCYAKANADKNGEFCISSVALGAWLDIHSSNIRRNYLRELVEFGYISKVSTPKGTFNWSHSDEENYSKYRIEVSVRNCGAFVLQNNDIKKLHKEAFFN